MKKMFKFFLVSAKRLLVAFFLKFKRALVLPAKPQFINFPITYRCNSRCVMCNIWQKYLKDKKKLKEELTLENLKRFFSRDRNWLAEVRHLGLTGGEPFLRQDLVEIVRLIRNKLPQAEVGIQTNGLFPGLIGKKLKEILAFYPDLSLAVSLDGTEKTHDRVRGIKGAFKKTLKTIAIAKRLGVKDITSGMTISQNNYQEALAVKKIAEKADCEFSCFLPDEADYFGNLGEKLEIDEKARKEVATTLKEFSYHYYMDNLRLQLEKKRKRELPCYSGWTSIMIDPYGDVFPCILRSEKFGNIKRQSLKRILTSKKARRIREKIKKCVCWSQCEVSTSAVVDPWDVVKWFLFHADKKKFLKKMLPKLNRID